MAHQEEQVTLWEADAATHEESLADHKQVSTASVDEIRDVGDKVVARVRDELASLRLVADAFREE